MRDFALQQLAAGQRRFSWIRDNINKRNAVEVDHLLEIDEAILVTVDIVQGQTEVGAV